MFSIFDQLSEQGNHDNRGGQVIQNRGKEKGDDGDDPKELDGILGGDAVGDNAEALMGIHQFHNGHSAQEEEKNFGDTAQMVAQFMADKVLEMLLQIA